MIQGDLDLPSLSTESGIVQETMVIMTDMVHLRSMRTQHMTVVICLI